MIKQPFLVHFEKKRYYYLIFTSKWVYHLRQFNA